MDGVRSEIPTRYPGVIALIEEYQWTYEQICDTPADLIDELLIRLSSRNKWQYEKHKRDESKARAANASKGKKR